MAAQYSIVGMSGREPCSRRCRILWQPRWWSVDQRQVAERAALYSLRRHPGTNLRSAIGHHDGMVGHSNRISGHGSLEWRRKLATGLLGLASGMGVNVLSDDAGYRGVAVVGATGAVVAAAASVRRMPSAAPITRLTVRSFLALAFSAALAAVLTSSSAASGYATVAAVIFTIAAVMILNPDEAITVLLSASAIGGGIALVGLGVAAMRGGYSMGAAILFTVGLACACVGIFALQVKSALAWLVLALVGIGVGNVSFGIAASSFLGLTGAVAFIAVGLALISYAGAVLQGGTPRIDIAAIGIGLAGCVIGIALLPRSPAAAAALAGLGLASVFLGIAGQRGSGTMGTLAMIGMGVATMACGILLLWAGKVAQGTAQTGLRLPFLLSASRSLA
jgi:hypothetical protein